MIVETKDENMNSMTESNTENTILNSKNIENANSLISADSNYLDLNNRVKYNKQMDLNTFFTKSRHYFIMTDGGKPIFSRYGDEMENCGILATFSAIMAKFTYFNSTQGTEKIHYITNNKTTTVFLKKGRLILIALSKRKDTISYLNSHLEYLFIQLLSIISSDRLARLENNPSYCMAALADTDEIFEQMVTYSSHTLISLLNCFHTLVIDSVARSRLHTLCSENMGDALIGLLLTPYEIVILCKSEMIPNIVSHDIILIQNLIFSSESLKDTESLIPICLPGISDAGYLQLYSKFLQPNIGLVFITESQELSIFLKFAEQAQNIYELAQKENLLQAVITAIEHKNKSITTQLDNKDTEKLIDDFFIKLSMKNEQININMYGSSNNDPFTSVKYLICKNKNNNQLFTFRFNEFDKITVEEKVVLSNYCDLYDIYNTQNLYINNNNFFHYQKNDRFSHIIQTSENYVLFATYNYFKDYNDISILTLEILKLIKYKESYFFINKY